eukprot:SAG31_NODE_44373_length_263_cov_0.628049_1_plen_51_part_01
MRTSHFDRRVDPDDEPLTLCARRVWLMRLLHSHHSFEESGRVSLDDEGLVH